MFDPTAFDNMKVVIEGALYDLDIVGEIMITDRNDLINMAKMSRHFDISFKLAESIGSVITAKIVMKSNLVNLAAELLPSYLPENQAGCYLSLQFSLDHAEKIVNYQGIESMLLDIWGSSRNITQTIIHLDPLKANSKKTNVITVDFGRLIGEEQMDDLVEMTDFMISTIKHLQQYKDKK